MIYRARFKSSTLVVVTSGVALLACDGGGSHRPKYTVEPTPDGGDQQGQLRLDAAAGAMDVGAPLNDASVDSGAAGTLTTPQISDGAQILDAAMPKPLADAGAPLCLLRTTQWSAPYPIEEARGLRADIVHDVSSDGRVWVYSVKVPSGIDAGVDAGLASTAPADAGVTNSELDAVDAAMVGDGAVDAALSADGILTSDPTVDNGPQYEDFIVRLPGEPVRLVLPNEVDLRHGATLNTASDALVVTLSDQSAFAIVHQNEDGEWATADSAGFGALQSAARHSGTMYSHPSLSKDGNDDLLYFSARNGGSPVLTTAFWNDLYWEVVASDGSLFMLLEPNPEHQVSSVSSDNRTVFTWDADRVAATAVELSLDEARPVQIAQNIASVAPVFVNKDCQRLYTLDEDSRFVELRSEPLVPADQLGE